MSVDSTTLERSALERKDREELTTIAQALGAKPPSRARKADIVQMILELTGVEPAGGAPGAGSAQPAPASDPAAVDDVVEPAEPEPEPEVAAATEAPAAEAGAAPAAPGQQSLAEWEQSVGPAAASPAAAAAASPAPIPAAASSSAPANGDTADPAASSAPTGASGMPATGSDSAGPATRPAGAPARSGAPAGSGATTGSGPSAPSGTAGPSGSPAVTGERRSRNRSGGRNGGTALDDRPGPGPRGGANAPRPSASGAGDPDADPGGEADTGNVREPGPGNHAGGPGGSNGGNPNAAPQNGGAGDVSGRADEGAANRSDQGNDNRADGGQGGQGDGESGNRRRRRRGRRGGGDAPQGGGQPTEEFAGEPVEVAGLLDLRDEGYGFLRVKGYLPSKDDIYVSVKQARQFGLRRGDHVTGASRPALRNEKNPALLRIDQVNGQAPDLARKRRRFEDLTPLFPDERLRLETTDPQADMTGRIIDLLSPIGKGQRGLIVSPPKAGKTTIMKQIARSIEVNSPDVKLIVLLVDERPEEVTDMKRWLQSPSSEVVASTFDRPSDEHAHVAELTIERAKRLVEEGQDVVIILDGITRLARAYNLAAPATGRIMSGGVDSGALYPPKRFFGAARNVEEGGSLTILATALIETGSKMDEVIFEEFKGTGNMELRLDRRLAERRVYPAIDVDASSTRHEELLFPRNQLQLVWSLRRVLQGLSSSEGGNAAALEMLIDRMKTFSTNDEFLAQVARNRPAG